MSPDYYTFKPSFFLSNGIAQTIIGAQLSGNTGLPERKVHKIQIKKQSTLMVLELPAENPDVSMILLALDSV